MSVTAALISYPAKVYDQVKAEGTYYPPNGRDIQQCNLSRSWDELHPALRSFGPPLSLALSGDYGFDGGLDRFGWDEENKNDHYLGFVSPTLVEEIASLPSANYCVSIFMRLNMYTWEWITAQKDVAVTISDAVGAFSTIHAGQSSVHLTG